MDELTEVDTVATYAIKYLRDLGVEVNNEPFKEHALYFRDALVLANAPRASRDRRPLNLFAKKLANLPVPLPALR